jgi:hypothetical protein
VTSAGFEVSGDLRVANEKRDEDELESEARMRGELVAIASRTTDTLDARAVHA